MNCNDFEAKIIDLASGRIRAEARDQALAHTADCRRCATRWRDEQRLTTGLRELAATFHEEQMPAHGEARLLAAFRAERPVAPVTRRSRRWPVWAAAAAAIIVLVLLAATRFVETDKPQPMAAQPPTPPSSPAPAAPSPGTDKAPSMTKKVSVPPRALAVDRHHRRPPAVTTAQAMRAGNPSGNTSPATAPATTASPAATNGDAPTSEIATSFISLAERRGLAPADSLQMVRVEMPRSALMSFGLPMNAERADERIKADILVGNDGIARAIRFVR